MLRLDCVAQLYSCSCKYEVSNLSGCFVVSTGKCLPIFFENGKAFLYSKDDDTIVVWNVCIYSYLPIEIGLFPKKIKSPSNRPTAVRTSNFFSPIYFSWISRRLRAIGQDCTGSYFILCPFFPGYISFKNLKEISKYRQIKKKISNKKSDELPYS